MKLYVLEYNESYTGGSVVVKCKSISKLKLLIKEANINSKLILDPYKIQLYKFGKFDFKLDPEKVDNLDEIKEVLKHFLC